jgi:predicted acylesterase/phospholipase RssA
VAPRGPDGARGQLPTAHYLAISGGSDNGAFGAGVIVGWTASGQRPEFLVVTGISAGALIAPFAFLGPDYDEQLREVFTSVAPPDILLLRRIPSALLFGEALADTTPLARLISRHVNGEILAAIAREYARGRLLLIGTVNLDVQRPVVWNIGAIAASGHPRALELFRGVLLASASIPGAFPPVLIDVEAEGRRYQEMHVDGGAATQVFLYPPSLDLALRARERGIEREQIAYVIRNDRLDPEWASTQRRLLAISRRSLATLVHFSGINDLVRIFITARRDGVRFRLAYIDPGFTVERAEPFDTAYMRALFDHAHALAREGYPWRPVPPGFSPADGRRERQ